jgi:hypothetical protein
MQQAIRNTSGKPVWSMALRVVFLFALFCIPVAAQRGMEAGALSPAPVAGGHSTYANLGGISQILLDTGDSLFVFANPTVTPATMTSRSCPRFS